MMASQDIFGSDDSGQSGDGGVSASAAAKKRQRKQTSIWSMEENNALVYEVEKYECIWNPIHQDYKNGKLKKVIWEKIQATELLAARSARECCDRWGVVRTAYKV